MVCRELGLDVSEPRSYGVGGDGAPASKRHQKQVNIGLVGKYVQLHDAYLSVAEALRHAGYATGR